MFRAAVRCFSTQTATPGSNPVLAMYREMLRLAAQLAPETKKVNALKRIREGFRTNRSVSNSEELTKLLQGATSRLNFLRAATPHRPRAFGSFVIENGRLVEGKADAMPRHHFIDKRVTDDQIKRHRQLIRKQRALKM